MLTIFKKMWILLFGSCLLYYCCAKASTGKIENILSYLNHVTFVHGASKLIANGGKIVNVLFEVIISRLNFPTKPHAQLYKISID